MLCICVSTYSMNWSQVIFLSMDMSTHFAEIITCNIWILSFANMLYATLFVPTHTPFSISVFWYAFTWGIIFILEVLLFLYNCSFSWKGINALFHLVYEFIWKAFYVYLLPPFLRVPFYAPL